MYPEDYVKSSSHVNGCLLPFKLESSVLILFELEKKTGLNVTLFISLVREKKEPDLRPLKIKKK